ncbi:MAG TPA: methyltransferase, partial [Actinomycetes bacterium]|nr:methyltransferase [Actinomycetes bacterium]
MGPHFKKTVTLDHGGRRLELGVAQELFSSHEVDVGTRLLLRTLAGPEHASRRRVLDLGCGYGPLGLALRAAAADRVVHLVDRDALAVEYSRENAARNRLDDVEVYGSLGYADVRGSGFDLIVSNIPAKAGPPVIEQLLLGGAGLLASGGLVAVVVIAPLRASVTAVLEGAPEVEVVFRRATASYAVVHYRFRDRPAPAAAPDNLGVYERGRLTVTHAGASVRLRTAWGLPEFDSLGVPTRLVADALLRPAGRPPRTALVLHPGQGHLPCLLWAGRRPAELRLVDRDLLALRFSQANLVANGCPPERVDLGHRVGPDPEDLRDADLVVAMLPPKEPPEATAATVRRLVAEAPAGARVVLGGSSTAVTRGLAALDAAKLPFRTLDRRRSR